MAACIAGLVMYLTLNGVVGWNLKEAKLNRIGIVDGAPGKITDFPYMARYRQVNSTEVSCGAAIVNEKYLVTSAFCAITRFQIDDETDKRVVTVGADKVEDGKDYEIEKTIIHPYFILYLSSSLILDYDIAVIKLKKNLTFSERVRPIELATEDLELKSGAVLTAMGFGPGQIQEKPSQLKKIKLAYVDNKTCRKAYKKFDRTISRRILCAGSSKKRSCYGDVGSPIIYNGTLVGVTAAGNPYCMSVCTDLLGTIPGLYTSISKHRPFIDGAID